MPSNLGRKPDIERVSDLCLVYMEQEMGAVPRAVEEMRKRARRLLDVARSDIAGVGEHDLGKTLAKFDSISDLLSASNRLLAWSAKQKGGDAPEEEN